MPCPGLSWAPARRNRSKIRWWSLGSMPRPLSATSKMAKPSLVRPRTEISPGTPGLRYFSALSSRFEKICSSGRRRRRGGGSMAERRDPLENIVPQLLEFAGEAHDVHQRRAQIVADDIGEALDFVVGLAKIGGALVDGRLEIEVIVAQRRFGVVTRTRRAPHQQDRDGGQHDDEA